MTTERDRQSKSWWSSSHHAASNHLLELQKEIKEEEEEIFADINSLINNRSNCLYSSQDDDCEDEYGSGNVFSKATKQPQSLEDANSATTTQAQAEQHQERQAAVAASNPIISLAAITSTTTTTTTTITTDTTTAKTIHNNNNNNNNNHLRTPYSSSRLCEQLFYSDDEEEDLLPNRYQQKSRSANNKISPRRDFQSNPSLGANQQQQRVLDDDDESSREHFHIDSGPPPEEVDFMQQEHYLDENHHLNKDPDDSNDDLYDASGHGKYHNDQISQHNYEAFQAVIQHVTSNLPKPCVFFLEGNCRRSDCKYSHDLSNITCKYWIEGFCFKGEMCPFLHSYNPPIDPSDPNSCLDEEGLNLLGNKELNPTFAIESEADFPSLPLDAPASALNDSTKSSNNTDSLTGTIRDQILSSNPAVVFKTVKKKRKKG